MAYRASYEVLCSCGERFTAQLCEYIFTEYDTELKDALLAGELNLVVCPSCRETFPAENRLLYRDEKNKLWVWMCRKEEEPRREELAAELLEGNLHFEDHFLDDKDHYRKHLVFGRNALISLLLKEDRDLRKTARVRLRKNPALRMILKDGSGGFLFLKGGKVKVALPLRPPPEKGWEVSGAEGRRMWLESYSHGLNVHNPFSSFLRSPKETRWKHIREKEPPSEPLDEYEDFARSWAMFEANPDTFVARFPLRSGFLDEVKKIPVSREVIPITPSAGRGQGPGKRKREEKKCRCGTG